MRFEVSMEAYHQTMIYEFNIENETWTQIGSIIQTRSTHAVSVVSYDDYSKWCQ